PALEPPVERGARTKFSRDGFPLTARTQHVEDSIEHTAWWKPAPSPGRQELFDRQQHDDAIPHVLRHAPHRRHTTPLPFPPLRHPPLRRVVVTTPSGLVLRGGPEIQRRITCGIGSKASPPLREPDPLVEKTVAFSKRLLNMPFLRAERLLAERGKVGMHQARIVEV